MIAYKLLKRRKNGTLGPLFINPKQVIPVGEWLESEDHPTKGYAHRPGWHCLPEPVAPHLSKNLKSGQERVWCKVDILGIQTQFRPQNQGGVWYLADSMRIIEVIG